MRYEVGQIDAWYDGEGWVWNTSWKLFDFRTDSTTPKNALLRKLKARGITFKRGSIVVIDDGNVIEVCDRRDGRPLFAAIHYED